MKDELIKIIEKELSYDAYLRYSCERCGNERKNYWIDHKDSLVSVIADKLNLKNKESICSIIEEVSGVTQGNKIEDAREIVNQIDDKIIGIPN